MSVPVEVADAVLEMLGLGLEETDGVSDVPNGRFRAT